MMEPVPRRPVDTLLDLDFGPIPSNETTTHLTQSLFELFGIDEPDTKVPPSAQVTLSRHEFYEDQLALFFLRSKVSHHDDIPQPLYYVPIYVQDSNTVKSWFYNNLGLLQTRDSSTVIANFSTRMSTTRKTDCCIYRVTTNDEYIALIERRCIAMPFCAKLIIAVVSSDADHLLHFMNNYLTDFDRIGSSLHVEVERS